MTANFKNEINPKFKSLTKEDWVKFRNGSICNGKIVLTLLSSMLLFLTKVSPCNSLEVCLGVAPAHHNIDIAMKKLIQLGIMEKSDNSQGLKVYRNVDMIRLHIWYEEDDSIEEKLRQLFLEGNTVIEARRIKRGKRKNASDGKMKRSKAKHRNTDNKEDIDDTDDYSSETKEV